MKTKDFALQVKDLSEDGIFEGYASTFGGSPDSYGDVVAPGAFAESLVKHRRDGTMPMMFFGHDASELPIGDWLEFAEDGKGLWAKGALDLEDPVSIRVHRAMKRKRVRGLSIGYRIPAGGSKPDEKRPGVTILEKVDLVEVSVVNMPANKRSLVDVVKAGVLTVNEARALEGLPPLEKQSRMDEFARRLRDGDPMPIKEFEDILREAGVPKSMAVAIASHGYAKAIRSESEGDQANDAVALLKALRG